VTDSLGATATGTVNVGPALKITPDKPTAPPGGVLNFTATGGSGTGYTWTISKNGSSGSINPSTGHYTAGGGASTVDTVRVTDSLGNFATVNVSVGGGIAITPDEPATSPRGTVQFSAIGGSNVFTWSMIASNSGGTIDPSTGLYTAGAIGDVVDIVKATDTVGKAAAVEVTVGPALRITPPSSNVIAGAVIGFTATGGSGAGYAWAIPSNVSGATIDPNGRYVAGPSGGTDIVRLTDSVGATAEGQVVVTAAPASHPPGTGQPGSSGGTSSGTINGVNIGGGGNDDCSCRTVGTPSTGGSTRVLLGVALALGLVARRRRR
jgi:MYXO-CTERM domain-containing protein